MAGAPFGTGMVLVVSYVDSLCKGFFLTSSLLLVPFVDELFVRCCSFDSDRLVSDSMFIVIVLSGSRFSRKSSAS